MEYTTSFCERNVEGEGSTWPVRISVFTNVLESWPGLHDPVRFPRSLRNKPFEYSDIRRDLSEARFAEDNEKKGKQMGTKL